MWLPKLMRYISPIPWLLTTPISIFTARNLSQHLPPNSGGILIVVVIVINIVS